MFIEPGISIIAGGGRPAKLGPLFRVDGKLFSVVPHHTFRGETVVKAAKTEDILGHIVDEQRVADEYGNLDIADSFRLVRLADSFEIDPRHIAVECADPFDYLGDGILKRSGEFYTLCKIVSVGGSCLMQGSCGLVRYQGAFEVRSDTVAASTGDAGAVISSFGTRRLIGMVLGIADGILFCVPALAILERYWAGRGDVEIIIGPVPEEV